MTRRFGSAIAFKAALEARFKTMAAERGTTRNTLQLKFVMERLLARLFLVDAPPWLLKGGFAMDLRFRPRARTTRDIDLSVIFTSGSPPIDFVGAFREQLQESVDVDLGDYLTYRIGTPKRELTNAPHPGWCSLPLRGDSAWKALRTVSHRHRLRRPD